MVVLRVLYCYRQYTYCGNYSFKVDKYLQL